MSRVIQRATFADAQLSDGAAALNRVFEHYLVPIAFSAEQLHLHIAYNDVDTSLSPLWYGEDGSVIAAALLGVRGKRGWIGGFGIAPEHRGRGYARELVEHMLSRARERGLQSIALEVLSENTPAIRVYERAGFEVTRRLHSVETIVEEPGAAPGFVRAEPEELIGEPDAVQPCWQRERATMLNGAVSSAVNDRAGTYALFRHNAGTAQVLKLNAASAEKLDALAHAVAQGHDFQRVLVLNEPEESPLLAYAQEARWNRPFLQYEMRISLLSS